MEVTVKIAARIRNTFEDHQVTVATNGTEHVLDIPSRQGGYGSGANGGELLFLALATCYCNDIYREAAVRGIVVERVEVEVDGQFGGIGEPAQGIRYRAKVAARADVAAIEALMRHTDGVSEIQNTLRLGMPVLLEEVKAVSLPGDSL
jgi:organic hydroperoxide reductase OsmC/OhrA